MTNSRLLLAIGLAALSSGFMGQAHAQTSPAAQSNDAPVRRIPLEVGDLAPDFTLKSALGEEVSLSSYRGKNNVVLYFYPKDNTPGCTREAQGFRDDIERFKKAGAVILGVSVDDVPSHKNFASKYSLTFPILSDTGGTVARQYGVMQWITAKRVTYVVGKNGKIKRVYAEVDSDIPGHSKSVLKAVQELNQSGSGETKTKAKAKPKSVAPAKSDS